MQKKSALTAALSSKLGDIPSSDDLRKNDTFSFPCLSPRSNAKQTGTEDFLEDGFEKLKLSEVRMLAGSASQSVTLPNGSLAVSLKNAQSKMYLDLNTVSSIKSRSGFHDWSIQGCRIYQCPYTIFI